MMKLTQLLCLLSRCSNATVAHGDKSQSQWLNMIDNVKATMAGHSVAARSAHGCFFAVIPTVVDILLSIELGCSSPEAKDLAEQHEKEASRSFFQQRLAFFKGMKVNPSLSSHTPCMVLVV